MRKKTLNKSKEVLKAAIVAVLLLTCFLSIQTAFAAPSGRSEIEHKITYHPNGGKGEIIEVYVKNNTEYTIKSQGYSRSGHKFVGWSSLADGSGTKYYNNQIIPNVTNSIILYAQWVRLM